jgi:hypothetical protein
MNNINGSIMQLALNERGEIRNTYGSRNIFTNVAVDFQTYNFQNYKLTLSRNVDKIIPEYLILNLYNTDTTLETIYNYGRNIYINFKIGVQTLLNIPLSILWNLKEPEICDNKLYLQIPFEMFFGNIYSAGLQFREVSFTLVNHTNLANYISDYSLLCKTYIGDSQYRRSNQDTSSCCIQQISSLEVKVSLDNPESVSNEFKIQTNSFPGFSKGFFIERNNISELNGMQFYIYGQIRIDYNRFMIRNKCQRINDNMIFVPFHADKSFNDRSFNSFVGSINLSEITQSSLKLNFDTHCNKVKIYSMNMNDYSQIRSEITISQNIVNTHLVEDFTRHSLMHVDNIDRIERIEIESIETNTIVNDIRVNTIFENNMNIIHYNNLYSGIGMSGPPNYLEPINNSIDDLIVDIGDTILIPEDKKTCGITLEEISLDEKYMRCTNCLNNFTEQSIRTWLTQIRTCPDCRCNWIDYNIYTNM